MPASISLDLSSDELIDRRHSSVARLNGGKLPSPTAWWSWTTHGREGLRLPTVKVGGRRLTSERALIEWIRAVTLAADGGLSTAMPSADSSVAKRRNTEIVEAVDRLHARREVRRKRGRPRKT